MQRLIPFLLLILSIGLVQAQPYIATRAAIYDQGPDPYFPPTGVAEMEIWRYIPGSRFESGWDLKIEDRSYNRDGHMLSWVRYQTVTGTLAWKKEVRYDAKGHRNQERITFAAEAPPVPYTWENETSPDGRLKSVRIKAADGSLFATVTMAPDGGMTYIEEPEKPAASRTYVFDKNGRSISFADASNGRKINYEYDFKGNLTKIRNQIPGGGESVVTYKNEYDSDGRLSRQTETNGNRVASRTFHYDKNGRLFMKADDTGHPVEYRDYYPDGRLSSILLTGPDGHPMEVVRFVYRNHSN